MNPTILVALITAGASLIGSLAGCWTVSKLQAYRVDQLEKKIEKVDAIENTQISIQGELDSFVQNAQERRRMVQNLEDEVSKMKNEIQQLTTKVALIENEIKLYHSGNHAHGT